MKHFFNPTILQCKRFVTKSSQLSSVRIAKDYEFDYYIDGDRRIYIDNKMYVIKKGSLVLRTPGQSVYSYGDYNCYILTLDFSGRILENYTRHTAFDIQPVYDSPIWDILPQVFVPEHRDEYLRIFDELTSITDLNLNNNEYAISLINEFLHLTLADALRRSTTKNAPATDYIDDICKYMKDNYADVITLDTLANMTHINKHYLTRKFKDRLGLPPISYLIQIRMENAARMLIETDLPIKEISNLCGYSDPSFFNYYFKKLFSITPAKYRDNHKK